MPKCQTIKRKHRKICVGDLDEEITVNTRAIGSPTSGGVDFQETFTLSQTAWALIETKRGEEIFDGSNIAQDITHYFYITYLDGLTAENWIDWNGDRFDVLDVENLDGRSEYQLLRCTNKGIKTQAANDV